MIYSFSPTQTPRRRPRGNHWVAPEHMRIALSMDRDDSGNLIMDPRPNIMQPERPKIYLTLMEPSAPPPGW